MGEKWNSNLFCLKWFLSTSLGISHGFDLHPYIRALGSIYQNTHSNFMTFPIWTEFLALQNLLWLVRKQEGSSLQLPSSPFVSPSVQCKNSKDSFRKEKQESGGVGNFSLLTSNHSAFFFFFSFKKRSVMVPLTLSQNLKCICWAQNVGTPVFQPVLASGRFCINTIRAVDQTGNVFHLEHLCILAYLAPAVGYHGWGQIPEIEDLHRVILRRTPLIICTITGSVYHKARKK